MSPERQGLFAALGLTALSVAAYWLIGPRPLRRVACSGIPAAWLEAFARFTERGQYLGITDALCALGPLTAESAYHTIAQHVAPPQLQAITSDPRWAQGLAELRGGQAP